MAIFELKIPKLGESIIEATLIRWKKQVGDPIQEEDTIAEIATDKVDSEIVSPVSGVLHKLLYPEGEILPIGQVIAHIETTAEITESTNAIAPEKLPEIPSAPDEPKLPIHEIVEERDQAITDRLISPLVKSMAKAEHITLQDLSQLPGSGKNGRITKVDFMNFVQARNTSPGKLESPAGNLPERSDRTVEMSRMRQLTARHMVDSVHTSPHVSSFIEIDVSSIVAWREKVKEAVLLHHSEKITYTHIFIEAVAKALQEFPGINASVKGNEIQYKKDINIGVATALSTDDLIVPVIKQADTLSLLEILKKSNALVNNARNHRLLPDDVQGGTFTITNLGNFGSLTGTPIINQPQVAILALGVITKRPVVIETPQGDTIGIRSMMIASLSFDHRIVDGAMGGYFLKKIAEIIQHFNPEREI